MFVSRKHRIVTLGLAVMLIASTILAIGAFAYPSPVMAGDVCRPTDEYACLWNPSCSIQWAWSRKWSCFLAYPWEEWRIVFCNCPS